MSIFVDSGVVYALSVPDAPRHEVARAAMEPVLAGAYGEPVTSDYVLDETVTLVRSRTGSLELATGVIDRLLARDDHPDVFTLRQVGRTEMERAVAVFEGDADHQLSFTDATTIALVRDDDLDAVLAFDDDFDGIVERLDPAEVAE